MTELTAQQRTWTRREGGGEERRHSNCKVKGWYFEYFEYFELEN